MNNLRNIFLISLLCVTSLFTSASFADPETTNISVVKENENTTAAESKSEITASEENSESEEAKKNKHIVIEQKNRPATVQIVPRERIRARREIMVHARPKPDPSVEQSSNISAPAIQPSNHIQVSRSDDINSVVPFRLGKKNVQRSNSDDRDRQISSESIRTRIAHDQELQDRERDVIAREREVRSREIEADLRTIKMREDKLHARQIQDGDLRVREIREADLRNRESDIRNRELSVRQTELDIRARELRARELGNNELRVREWQDIKSRDKMFRYLQLRDRELHRRVMWHDDRGRVCYYLTTFKKVTRVNKRVTVCKWINGVYTCYHPKRYFIYPVTREVCYWIR